MNSRIDRLLPHYSFYKTTHTMLTNVYKLGMVPEQTTPHIIDLLSHCVEFKSFRHGLATVDAQEYQVCGEEFATAVTDFIEEVKDDLCSYESFTKVYEKLDKYLVDVHHYEFRNAKTIQKIGEHMGLSIGLNSLSKNMHAEKVIGESEDLEDDFRLEVPRLEVWYAQTDRVTKECVNESIVAHLLLNEFSGKWQAFINYKKLSDTYIGELASFEDLVNFFGRVRTEIEDYRFYVNPEDIPSFGL